jgi:thiamine biosynthesis protein ThiS
MNVIFNRSETEADDGISLYDFILSTGLNPARIIVELNGSLVPGGHWRQTVLNDGDCILAVTFVGGG